MQRMTARSFLDVGEVRHQLIFAAVTALVLYQEEKAEAPRTGLLSRSGRSWDKTAFSSAALAR